MAYPRSDLYYAGLSYRRIELFVDRYHEAIRNRYYRLKHFFEPDCQHRQGVLDEMTAEIYDEQHHTWAAVDCEALEILAVDVSPGALLNPRTALR